MNSIILCEGPDDLWFISYYLHKRDGWDIDKNTKRLWRQYKIVPLNDHQDVKYLKKDNNGVAVWYVGGKDCFENPIKTAIKRYVSEIPSEAVGSIVIVRDRDIDEENVILRKIEKWLPGIAHLENRKTTEYRIDCENGETAYTRITPIIIPFDGDGAIETLLLNSISESSQTGRIIVDAAKNYVNSVKNNDEVCRLYLVHQRFILKAQYSATIAVTNPDHSTGQFQDMVMNCPWENSPYVRSHFEIILRAIAN